MEEQTDPKLAQACLDGRRHAFERFKRANDSAQRRIEHARQFDWGKTARQTVEVYRSVEKSA